MSELLMMFASFLMGYFYHKYSQAEKHWNEIHRIKKMKREEWE